MFMQVSFFSNFLNHHQLPFSQAMVSLTNGNYSFIANTPIEKERISMGYADMNEAYPFVVRAYEDQWAKKLAEDLALTSDIIITGSAPEKYTAMRIAENKLTFRYSERIYKKGLWRAFLPTTIVGRMLRDIRYKNKNLYMLCASAYTAYDYSLHGAYIGKTFKWGYFPEVKIYKNLDELFDQKEHNGIVSILWVGRLIGWKHPDVSIRIAERLKKQGYKFHLDIIGNGILEKKLCDMVEEKNLIDCVHILGSMPPDEVRKHMEKANIYLFTSDFNEGWGAVLNESMNSGCAVVASHAIGSVPFLIKNGENGLIYENGNIDYLFKQVKRLVDDRALCEKLGRKAYSTLKDVWNADVAAERLLKLAECIEDGGDYNNLFKDGPCSRAEIIKNGWFKENLVRYD